MSNLLEKAKALGPDISDWVVHSAKGSLKEARDVLKGILAHGLKNHDLGICFTESPVAHFANVFSLFEAYGRREMLEPFGLAAKKQWLFERGGWPVIYSPKGERHYPEDEIDYLFEPYQPGDLVFTWLREWRTNSGRLNLLNGDTVLIFPDHGEAPDSAYTLLQSWLYPWLGMEPSFEPEWDLSWQLVTLARVRKWEATAPARSCLRGN